MELNTRDAQRIKCPYCENGWFRHQYNDTWVCDKCRKVLYPPDASEEADPEVVEVMLEDMRRGKRGGGSKSGRRKKPVKKVVQGMYEGV